MDINTKFISDIKRLTSAKKLALEKVCIHTIKDLLYYFPSRYETFLESDTEIPSKNKKVLMNGVLRNVKMRRVFRKKTMITEATLQTKNSNLKIIWFNQPYIAKKFNDGEFVEVNGVVGGSIGKQFISNPIINLVTKKTFPNNTEYNKSDVLNPIYKETKGLTSRWIFTLIAELIDKIDDTDVIPKNVLKKYSLPSTKDALIRIHTPRNQDDVEVAKKRFAFEEIFLMQVRNCINLLKKEKSKAFSLETDEGKIAEFIKTRFEYEPTIDQSKSIKDIFNDLKTNKPMTRLLSGDVGVGKTLVAATMVYGTIISKPKGQDFGRLQVAYMAPTEVLARQQYETMKKLFSHLPISIALITSNGCKKFPSKIDPNGDTDISKKQLLEWVENGEIPIVVGTHSLIQKDIKFKHLASVVIDEQHRFGVAQRQKLITKSEITPHFLSMTATPIPRTLALIIYGDLDISTIKTKPLNRKEVVTKILKNKDVDKAYKLMEEEIEKGRQVYIICPRIEEGEENTLELKSVEETTKEVKRLFPKLKITSLHGKYKKDKKESVMKDFSEKKYDVLVTTTVIEVGIDIPNTSTIIINNAERFGLSQLHQLRGRVVRSNHQSYCVAIVKNDENENTLKRIKLFEKYSDGFKLAQEDLENRGTGELMGKRQSGFSDIAMLALKNEKLVEFAKKEASLLIKKDPELKKHPLIKEAVSVLEVHQE